MLVCVSAVSLLKHRWLIVCSSLPSGRRLTPPVATVPAALYSAARGTTTLLAPRTYMRMENIAVLLKLLYEYLVLLGHCYPRVDMSPCCQHLSPPRRCGG